MVDRKRRPLPRPTKCPFCEGKADPDYKKPDELKVYLTGRGKIAGRDKTGVCTRHQKLVAQEIKRARHLGLIPFVKMVR